MNYQELKTLVKKHCHLYYNRNLPEISDQEFDNLYDLLEAMEQKQGWADHDSPTRKVGGIAGKVKHPYKLYSLKKVYDINEVDSDFSIELPKIDGANVTVVFRRGKLTLAMTRGDGEFGEDITNLVSHISNIPTKINTTQQEVIINGECVTDNEVSNFRNYVSGALGLDSEEEFKTRNIKFIAHDWLGVEIDYKARMGIVKSFGFDTVFDKAICDKYPQDGVVYRLDSYTQSVKLGWTAKYPRFAVALKPKGLLTTTASLQDVIWIVGRTGTVNPVGIIQPVSLDGAIISRVTLHNIAVIEEHSLALGDVIEIERAGGVIPKFIKVVDKSILNSTISAKDAEEQLGIKTYRVGPKLFCKDHEQLSSVKVLEHFIAVMGIKGLGPASVKKLQLTHPLDLYKDQNWAVLGLNGSKVKAEVNKSKEKPYRVVLAALGIPLVGLAMAEKIVSKIPRFDRLRDIENIKIDGIADKIIENILSWLDINEDWVTELPLNLTEVLTTEILEKEHSKKVCITGKLDLSRSELSEILSRYGFDVKDTVTRDLYVLISGGDTSSSKYKKAETYGIRIVDFWTNKEEILNGQI